MDRSRETNKVQWDMSSSEKGKMGSAASTKKFRSELDDRRKILLQRKVTLDLLEKLARSLPQVPNGLSKTLKLQSDIVKELEWKGNLYYLEKWKISQKDDATIGNLIQLLRASGFKEEVWDCLFNISREPKNATTITDNREEVKLPQSDKQIQKTSDSSNLGTDKSKQQDYQLSQVSLLPDHKRTTTSSSRSISFTRNQLLASDSHNQVLDTTKDVPGFSSSLGTASATSQPDTPKTSTLHATIAHIHHDEGLGAAEARRIIPLRQKWLDFRDWGEVKNAWEFGAHARQNTMAIGKEDIGDYLPGIADEILVSDTKRKKLLMFNALGELMTSINTERLAPGGVCTTTQDVIAVCGGNVVGLWNSAGEYMGEFGRDTFRWCRGIAVDQNGRFIVSDVETHSVTVHAPDGQFICRLQAIGSNKFNKPYYVSTNYKNQILVCDSRNHCVKVFDSNGKYLNKFGNFGTCSNQFRVPLGITTDCCGNMLINDYGNQRVSLFSSGGWFLHNVLTSSQNNIGQPIALATTSKNQLLLSTVDTATLSVFEFESPGHGIRSPLDFPSY